MKYLSLLLLNFSLAATADTQVVIIGGGYELSHSEGQIEENVFWLENLLRPEVDRLDIFYGNGAAEQADVVYWDPDVNNTNRARNPVADVYLPPNDEYLRYRKHRITANMGSTERSHLIPGLTAVIENQDYQDLLIIYNGHGAYRSFDYTQNSLKLWNDSEINVREFRQLLNQAPATKNIRFVMTQCYSGGFFHLLNESEQTADKTKHTRCGFMAESERRQSEGCELGINKEDFRDYTTYFYAALSGQDRFGDDLASDPDINQDGKVSFREAHLYTLRTAVSSDLSRSTSEMFLEQWQPWHSRWLIDTSHHHSEYYKIALAVADNNAIDIKGNLGQQRGNLETSFSALRKEKDSVYALIDNKQQQIQQRLETLFPFLRNPYSSSFIAGIANQQADIAKNIEGENYQQLVELLNTYDQLLVNELQLKRQIVQVEKVRRLIKLAKLESSFQRLSSASDREAYARILACEEGTL